MNKLFGIEAQLLRKGDQGEVMSKGLLREREVLEAVSFAAQRAIKSTRPFPIRTLITILQGSFGRGCVVWSPPGRPWPARILASHHMGPDQSAIISVRRNRGPVGLVDELQPHAWLSWRSQWAS